MSTTVSPAGRGKGKKGGGKAPFWKMEIGRKSPLADDEDVEHPPFVATLPRVDLLPASVRQSFTLRTIRRWVIAAVVVLVVAVAGVWFLQSARILDAETSLAQAESEGRDLQAQMEALGPVKAFYTSLENQRTLVDGTLASQPQTALVIQRLAESGTKVSGSPVVFSDVEITYGGIPAAGTPLNSCPNPDPFGTEITIGCVTFNAVADSRQAVSQLLEEMDADPLFVGPYVTSTSLTSGATGSGTQITFSGTTGISPDALVTPLTAEQLDALVNPPAAKPTDREGESE